MGLLAWLRGRPSASAADALLEAGIAAHERGAVQEAALAFERALAARPGHARSLTLLAVARLSAGRAAEAEDLAARAVAADPGPALHWHNHGAALAALERPAQAARAFAEAVARDPGHRAALFNLCRARTQAGDAAGASAAARSLHALDPTDPLHRAELGAALHRVILSGQPANPPTDAGEAADLIALALERPDAFAPAERLDLAKRLADLSIRIGRHDRALALLGAPDVPPDDAECLILRANALNASGRAAAAAPLYERVVAQIPDHAAVISSAVSAGEYDDALDPASRVARRARLVRGLAAHAPAPQHDNDPDPERRIRLGYVSPDFRTHVSMSLFEGVLERHDRARFEIFCYDATTGRDARNAALRVLADHWREIDQQDDAAVAAQVRTDRIDLLVDLAGHTTGNRLGVFARRPAPVSATWLAWPGSTGLEAIDYLVSDPWSTPPALEVHCSEAVMRLPEARFCYRPPAGSPEPALPPADAPVVFACFNNPSKFSPRALALWRRILERVPGARLRLKYHGLDDGEAGRHVRAALAAAGMPAGRVELLGWSGYEDTLALYRDVHVALDPFPFCGGLTSFDALWMGVPVVTLETPFLAGRQTLAMLGALGHGELVTGTPDAYVDTAVALAGARERLAHYRAGLRDALRVSALVDYARFTPQLEAAWRTMWRTWCGRRRGPGATAAGVSG